MIAQQSWMKRGVVALAILLIGPHVGCPGAIDEDGDGWVYKSDCDDTDATVNPGQPEVECNDRDDDCDATTLDAPDRDADGYSICSLTPDCDDADASLNLDDLDLDGYSTCDGDCLDDEESVHPGAEELCDGLDNDCLDGVSDDELDEDGDGYWSCEGDCDDADAARFPGNPEVCDGLDNDCDLTVPADEVDADADGQMECDGDCNDADIDTYTGATEICDGLDNDCDQLVPSDELDDDADGVSECEGDCDDAAPESYPGAAEICDGVDNDCDSVIPVDETDDDTDGLSECEGDCDDGDSSLNLADADGDGYDTCSGDCDDVNADVFPTAPERCNQLDDNCDGDADEGFCGDASLTDADTRLLGETTWDMAGTFVAGGGDLDGDGYDDIVIGASAGEFGGVDSGVAYVLYGPAPSGDLALSTAGAVLHGEHSEDAAGFAVSIAGDVDGDGLDDVLVGAHGYDYDCDGQLSENIGVAFLVHGPMYGEIDLLDEADSVLCGLNATSHVGRAVSGAGDANGDGYSDVLVGASLDDEAGDDAGAAYLVYGPFQGESSLDAAAVRYEGESEGDQFGHAVGTAGDVDGDGLADLLLGARYEDTGGSSAGAVYLVYATELGMGSIATDAVKLHGEAAYSDAGNSVSGAGDVDGDGLDDFLVGAWRGDANLEDEGVVYLFTSTPVTNDSVASADARITGETAGDHAGRSVAILGDVNGDGFDDVLIGAHHQDTAAEDAGAAYLLYGPISGPTPLGAADARFYGEVAESYAGWSVAAAGDLDGNGLADLMVGAPSHDDALPVVGRAYLLLSEP